MLSLWGRHGMGRQRSPGEVECKSFVCLDRCASPVVRVDAPGCDGCQTCFGPGDKCVERSAQQRWSGPDGISLQIDDKLWCGCAQVTAPKGCSDALTSIGALRVHQFDPSSLTLQSGLDLSVSRKNDDRTNARGFCCGDHGFQDGCVAPRCKQFAGKTTRGPPCRNADGDRIGDG